MSQPHVPPVLGKRDGLRQSAFMPSVSHSSPPAEQDAAPEIPKGLSVVVPVYNSAASLGRLVGELAHVLPELAARYELILVEDGSRDASWQVILEMSREHEWVHGIRLMRNYGQHNALLCGIRTARFDTTVTMDDDLEHPPDEIRKLLGQLNGQHDVVYGTPENSHRGIWRNMGSLCTRMALGCVMGAHTARKANSFRALRTRLRDAFLEYRSPVVSIDVLLTWGTTRFTAVPVRGDPRATGVSNYTFRKLVIHALTMLTGFSTVPLRLANLMGFLLTGFGLLVLIYVVGRLFIEGTSVPGFPFLASIIAIFSGAQMFALGIIGEYLARIHFRTMEQPTYTVFQEVNGSASPDSCPAPASSEAPAPASTFS